jgi:hypothetical protein
MTLLDFLQKLFLRSAGKISDAALKPFKAYWLRDAPTV